MLVVKCSGSTRILMYVMFMSDNTGPVVLSCYDEVWMMCFDLCCNISSPRWHDEEYMAKTLFLQKSQLADEYSKPRTQS